MPGLNLRDVRQLPVPIPPPDVQARIASQLDDIALRVEILKRSFSTLGDALPGLERELLLSFAYGRHAAALSLTSVGPHEEDLSLELLDALESASVTHRDKQPVDEASGADELTTPEHEATLEVRPIVPRITGRIAATNKDDVTALLTRLNRPISPEALFDQLALAESAIDSFYSALRELRAEQRILISRPDSTTVTIELRSPQ
jgi:type I restriction enzyme, S subunit